MSAFEDAAAQAEAELSEQSGTEDIQGQPDVGTSEEAGQPIEGTEDIQGQPDDDTSETGGQPDTGKELLDGKTPEQIYKSYKELQTDFAKRNEAEKALKSQFEPYGGIESVLNAAKYLSEGDRIQRLNQFLQQENDNQLLNQEYGTENDEDTQAALRTIQQTADQIAEQKIKEMMEKHVNPLIQENQAQKVEALFSEMDKDPFIGEDWRKYKSVMAETIKEMPQEFANNINLDNLKTIFWTAVGKSGDIESFMANAHNKKLERLKKKSIDSSGTPSNAAAKKSANSFLEAFEAAEEIHGRLQ